MEIVVNRCAGGFSLSKKAIVAYANRKGLDLAALRIDDRDIDRDDPDLVAVVRELGDEANCRWSKLEIVSVPDGISWEIEEYDGREWISERHRRW